MRLATTLVALFLISIIAVAGAGTSGVSEDQTPEEIALSFIEDAPTYTYDGVRSTLRVRSVAILKSYPPQYLVTVEFDCLHGGYGDREDVVVLQVITPHTAVVRVVESEVVEAVIDGRWDELKQEFIEEDDAATVVENIAIGWLMSAPTFSFDGVSDSVKVTDSWQAMTFAAPSFWGVIIEFDCLHTGYGDRTGQILAQVITHHVATMHVTDGSVTLTHIDDAWDEIKQTQLSH
jgi:hypothetical protein